MMSGSSNALEFNLADLQVLKNQLWIWRAGLRNLQLNEQG
jgi:hypothetical protein